MSEEKIITAAPVTEGTVTIIIAEYRGLIEAVEQYKAALDLSAAEKDKSWWKAYHAEKEVAKRDIQITELRKQIAELREQIAELKEAGRKVCDFIDSKPQLRSEYNLFQCERDLERSADAVESEVGNENAE